MKPKLLQANLVEALFARPSQLGLQPRRYRVVGLVVLFLIGAAHWYIFFSGAELDFHDWPEEIAILTTWAEAIQTWELPLHTSPGIEGSRFLANPEISISPQLVLLAYFGPVRYPLVNTLLMYTIGFTLLIHLARQMDLGMVTTTILFLLFNMNGHLVAHLSIGHFMWLGYFMLPGFLTLVVQAVQRGPSKFWSTWMSVLLFVILIQGFFHLVYWSVLVLLLLALARPQIRKAVLSTIAITLGLSSVRLLPALIVFERSSAAFISGFPTLLHVFEGLAVLKSSLQAVHEIGYSLIGWWEIDHYVSGLGLVYILIFGLVIPFKERGQAWRVLRGLSLPLITLTVLSIGPTFGGLARIPGPFFAVERVSSRFFLVPLLFLIIIACMEFQAWLDRKDLTSLEQVAVLLGVLMIEIGLAEHTRAWAPDVTRTAFGPKASLPLMTIVSLEDPIYSAVLAIGAAVSALTLCYLAAHITLRLVRRTEENP